VASARGDTQKRKGQDVVGLLTRQGSVVAEGRAQDRIAKAVLRFDMAICGSFFEVGKTAVEGVFGGVLLFRNALEKGAGTLEGTRSAGWIAPLTRLFSRGLRARSGWYSRSGNAR
jgi:hypothetical protein